MLTNCTVSANSATSTGGGLYNFNGPVTLDNTIVAGNTAGGDVSGSYSGSNDFVGGNPMLAPLGNYGGLTQTMPPLPGSPVIGKVPANTSGTPTTDQRGFTRNTAAATDAGADQSGPTPTDLVVNTTTDVRAQGTLTLREAINLADVSPGNETVTFSTTVFGSTSETITLTGGQLNLTRISGTLAIQGPGANLLSISGNNASTVFALYLGVTATLSGLTVAGGNAGNYGGGGLCNQGGTVTLNNCTISGNSAFNGGAMDNIEGSATLNNCTVSGNSATNDGGGLYNSFSTDTLTNCTVSGNSAEIGGGGLFDNNGAVMLTNCTVSGNTTNCGGGLDRTSATRPLWSTAPSATTPPPPAVAACTTTAARPR